VEQALAAERVKSAEAIATALGKATAVESLLATTQEAMRLAEQKAAAAETAQHEAETELSAAIAAKDAAQDALRKIQEELECPIGYCSMKEPVVATDGHTYERQAIRRWFADGHRTSPMTREPMGGCTLVKNLLARRVAQHLRGADGHPLHPSPSRSSLSEEESHLESASTAILMSEADVDDDLISSLPNGLDAEQGSGEAVLSAIEEKNFMQLLQYAMHPRSEINVVTPYTTTLRASTSSTVEVAAGCDVVTLLIAQAAIATAVPVWGRAQGDTEDMMSQILDSLRALLAHPNLDLAAVQGKVNVLFRSLWDGSEEREVDAVGLAEWWGERFSEDHTFYRQIAQILRENGL